MDDSQKRQTEQPVDQTVDQTDQIEGDSDSESGGYYYDDATGYEVYEEGDEDDDEDE